MSAAAPSAATQSGASAPGRSSPVNVGTPLKDVNVQMTDTELDQLIERSKTCDQILEEYPIDPRFVRLAQRLHRSMMIAKMDQRVIEDRLHTVMGYNGGRNIKIVQLSSKEQEHILTNYRRLVKRVVCFNYAREFINRKQWQKVQSMLQIVLALLGPLTDELDRYIPTISGHSKPLPQSEWREALEQSAKLGFPSFSEPMSKLEDYLDLANAFVQQALPERHAQLYDHVASAANASSSTRPAGDSGLSESTVSTPLRSSGRSPPDLIRVRSLTAIKDPNAGMTSPQLRSSARDHTEGQIADAATTTHPTEPQSTPQFSHHHGANKVPLNSEEIVRSVREIINESVRLNARLNRINPKRDAEAHAHLVAARQHDMLYPLGTLSQELQNESTPIGNSMPRPTASSDGSDDARTRPSLRHDNSVRFQTVIDLMNSVTICAQSNLAGFVALKQSREELLLANHNLRRQIRSLQKELDQERANSAAMRTALMQMNVVRSGGGSSTMTQSASSSSLIGSTGRTLSGSDSTFNLLGGSSSRRRSQNLEVAGSPVLGPRSQRTLSASPSTLKLLENTAAYRAQLEQDRMELLTQLDKGNTGAEHGATGEDPTTGSPDLSLVVGDASPTLEPPRSPHRRIISLPTTLQTHDEGSEDVRAKADDEPDPTKLDDKAEIECYGIQTNGDNQTSPNNGGSFIVTLNSKQVLVGEEPRDAKQSPKGMRVEGRQELSTVNARQHQSQQDQQQQQQQSHTIRRARPMTAGARLYSVDSQSTSTIDKRPLLPVRQTRSTALRNSHRLMKLQLMHVLHKLNGQPDNSETTPEVGRVGESEAHPLPQSQPRTRRNEHVGGRYGLVQGVMGSGVWGDGSGVPAGEGVAVSFGDAHSATALKEMLDSSYLQQAQLEESHYRQHQQQQQLQQQMHRRPKSAMLPRSNKALTEQLMQPQSPARAAASYNAYGLTNQQLRLALQASALSAYADAEASARRRSPPGARPFKRSSSEESQPGTECGGNEASEILTNVQTGTPSQNEEGADGEARPAHSQHPPSRPARAPLIVARPASAHPVLSSSVGAGTARSVRPGSAHPRSVVANDSHYQAAVMKIQSIVSAYGTPPPKPIISPRAL